MNKTIFLFAFAAFYTNASISQPQIEISSEREFGIFFQQEVLKSRDTIEKTVKRYDVLYVRFKITEDGVPDSILFSVKQPAVLIEVIKSALSMIKLNTKGIEKNTSYYYVLPVNYDFTPDIKPGEDALTSLFARAEKIDESNWQSFLNFDNNDLFKADGSAKGLWGIKCVLLPPVKVTRHNTFSNSTQTFQ